jgi:hypothetical protein
MRPTEKIKRLFGKTKVQVNAEFDNKIMNDVLAAFENLNARYSARQQPSVWRIIMKSRITHLTVAAIIIAAVILFTHFVGGPFRTNITFANVIEPIMNARTVVFDFIAGREDQGPVIHDIVVGSRIRRTMSNGDVVMIFDTNESKMLVLNTQTKEAAYIDIEGPLKEGTKNFMEFVRRSINNLKDIPSQKLGETNIDGLNAIGFKTKGPNEEITIWADPQTSMPIRIELKLGRENAQAYYILKNIKIDVPVDKSLMSMDVPPGYSQQKAEFNMSDFSEHDFIESLRAWAQYVMNGTFPDTISVEDYLKTVPLLGEGIGKAGLSQKDGEKIGITFSKGMLFLQQMAPKGMDFHYVGSGVKLGQADKAIFWYQPEGSQDYRVIYGDLRVEEETPENLPR